MPNGNDLDPDTAYALDRLIYDQPDSVKARVRKYAQERGIKVRDPLWEILILLECWPLKIEDSTERSTALFNDLLAELKSWQQGYKANQKQMATQVAWIEKLSEKANALSDHLNSLGKLSTRIEQRYADILTTINRTSEVLNKGQQEIDSHHNDLGKLAEALTAFRIHNKGFVESFLNSMPRYKIYMYRAVLFGGFCIAILNGLLWFQLRKQAILFEEQTLRIRLMQELQNE